MEYKEGVTYTFDDLPENIQIELAQEYCDDSLFGEMTTEMLESVFKEELKYKFPYSDIEPYWDVEGYPKYFRLEGTIDLEDLVDKVKLTNDEQELWNYCYANISNTRTQVDCSGNLGIKGIIDYEYNHYFDDVTDSIYDDYDYFDKSTGAILRANSYGSYDDYLRDFNDGKIMIGKFDSKIASGMFDSIFNKFYEYLVNYQNECYEECEHEYYPDDNVALDLLNGSSYIEDIKVEYSEDLGEGELFVSTPFGDFNYDI